MARVVIGMDPHKRSATIEVVDEREGYLRPVGSVPAGKVIGSCWPPAVSTRSGCGRWRDARAWAAISLSGWWLMANRWWTFRRNCLRGTGFRDRSRAQDRRH